MKNIDSNLIFSNDLILAILFIAILGDYVLTYVGMNILGVIEELNPLMIRSFKLPFIKGLILRTIIGLFPIILFKLVENKFGNINTYRVILLHVLVIEFIPYCLHIFWIINYISF